VRLFVALDLTRDVRARLEALQAALRTMPLPLRWARPEGIHLTLKFLGEVARERLDEVEAALEAAAPRHAPFLLEAEGVGTFPEAGPPRVIWVGVRDPSGAARALQESIEAELEAIGFARERRGFTPHLTLGRAQGPGRGDWRSFLERSSFGAPERFAVGDYVLFLSRPGPGGTAYQALRRYSLEGGVSR